MMSKKCGIYLIRDKENIIDEYHLAVIADLAGHNDYVYVLVDENTDKNELAKLENIQCQIIKTNKNSEDPIDSYRTFFEKNTIPEDAASFALVNDEWYGPVSDTSRIFEMVSNEDCKVWCLSQDCKKDFFGFAITEGNSKEAIDILNNIEKCPIEVIYSSEELNDLSNTVSIDFPVLLMENEGMPYIRKKIFTRDYFDVFDESTGETAREVMEFIHAKTNFNRDIIWKNLIRTQNMADIQNIMQLNTVLSSTIPMKRKNTIKKIALQLHLYYEDQAESCRHYIESMPEGVDIFITVPDEKKKENAERVFKGLPYNIEIRIIGNRGRDVGSLLTGVKDVIMNYDLVCSVHDKKVTQVAPMSIGESWSYKCFENLLRNKIYVENVIAHFEENPLLGMAEPPAPNHGPYYPVIGQIEWGQNYDNTFELKEKLKIKAPMSKDKHPVAPIGTMFWFRPKALKPLYDHDWKYEEYPKEPNNTDGTLLHALERIYPFAVQDAGYYVEWLMVDTYAQMETDNFDYMNHELFRQEFKHTKEVPFKKMISDFREETERRKQQ